MKKKTRIHTKLRDNKRVYGASAILIVAVVGYLLALYVPQLFNSRAATTWPSVPPAQICGDTALLSGPATAPAGAVVVPAGDNTELTPNWNGDGFTQSNKTFWFAPGVHTLGTDQYAQIQPGSGSTYIGAPGAIIDGQNINEKAFTTTASNVTIKYLTIRNFITPHDQGTVNGDAGAGWTVSYNTMTGNNGAAIFAGDNNVISYNCLKDNGQYGFQTAGGSSKILIDHNEISGNNAANTEQTAGIENCGCSGGSKFWDSREVTVTNNYVHDNKGAGLWADTINVGFLIEGNWIENNDGEGIFMEVSYNFKIINNVLKHNGTVFGPSNPGFPTGAIYISESGSDPRVTTSTNNFNTASEVSNNLFEDNWGGMALWENSDRFCSQGLPTVECTLVDPARITVASCEASLADPVKSQPGYSPSYFNDCRWKTQNVKVHHNVFKLNPANVSGCSVNKACGINALISNYGSSEPYTGSIVPYNIAFNQGNSFYSNTYEGPWYFWGWSQSNTIYPITFTQWTAAPTTKCNTPSEISSGTCSTGFGQDAGSTYNATPPVSTSPVVMISAPSNGTTIKGTVAFTASASDDGTIAGIQFKIDGVALGMEDTSAPYTTSLNTTGYSDGSHTLSATARDNDGNTSTTSITVRFGNTAKQGDINNDTSINTLDLSIILANWNKTTSFLSNANADANKDGIVNTIDLSIVLSNWGK